MKRLTGAVLGIALALGIALLPSIEGLDRVGQMVLAVVAITLVFLIFEIFPWTITIIMALALFMIVGVKSDLALHGFAVKPFWLVLGVLFYGRAMEKTGLAKRVSYLILGAFRPSYPSILLSFTIIGFVLALGIPSITVRIAIIMPVAFALTQALGLQARSRGTSLICLGAWIMSIVPGYAFLTGSLYGPFLMGAIAPELRDRFTWTNWLIAFMPPVVLLSALLFVALLVLFRPEKPLQAGREVIAQQIKLLGRFGRRELSVAGVVGVSVLAWVTQPWHGMDSAYIAMLGAVTLFASGVLDPEDIQTGISWPILIFLGGLFSFEEIFPAYHLDAWMGRLFIPLAEPFLGNPLLLTLVVALLVYLVRFVEVGMWPTLLIVYLPMVGVAMSRGIGPHVLAVVVILSSNVFFVPYQNMWVPMAEAITGGQGWAASHRTKLALAFGALNIVALLAGTVYWGIIGPLR